MRQRHWAGLLACLVCFFLTGCGKEVLTAGIATCADECFRARIMQAAERGGAGAREETISLFFAGDLVFAVPPGWTQAHCRERDIRVYCRGKGVGMYESYVGFQTVRLPAYMGAADPACRKREAETFLRSLFREGIVRMRIRFVKKDGGDDVILAAVRTRRDGKAWDHRIYMIGRGFRLYVIRAGRSQESREDVYKMAWSAVCKSFFLNGEMRLDKCPFNYYYFIK